MAENSSLWPLGAIIYILGTFGESLGANLQRKSLLREARLVEANPEYKARGKFKQATWKVGFFMFVGAGICMSIALFFASQTLLAPLQLFLFISNVGFANLINREPFNWIGADGISTAFVIGGVIMCVVSAPKATHNFDSDELIQLMQQPGFISFCVGAFALICFLFFSKRAILKSCGNDPKTIPQRWKRTYLNMSYGALAGAFGGVNVTLTKTTFSLMSGEFEDDGIVGVVSSPLLWGVSITLICTYVGQMWVTVNGLGIASAIIVISSHSVTEEVVATLGGILYFEDYEQFDAHTWALFCVGNIVAIAAVIYLSHLRLSVAEAEEQRESRASVDFEFTLGSIIAKESDALVSPAASPMRSKKAKKETEQNGGGWQNQEGADAPLQLDIDAETAFDDELGVTEDARPRSVSTKEEQLAAV